MGEGVGVVAEAKLNVALMVGSDAHADVNDLALLIGFDDWPGSKVHLRLAALVSAQAASDRSGFRVDGRPDAVGRA